MTRSIRSRLTVYLLGGIGVLLIAAGLVLESNISRWLEREFDQALEAKARALVTLTKQDRAEVELDFADELMPEFESAGDPHYFELWLGSRTLLERSNSFKVDAQRSKVSLPRESTLDADARFLDFWLPDGRAGRRVRIDFVPQMKDEGTSGSEPILDPTESSRDRKVPTATILVAREREGLDTRIQRLRMSVLLFTVLLMATLAALIAIALRIGLRPLGRLTRQVQTLDAQSLDRRIDIDSPPREIEPVVDQLNALLVRLETSFRRERQLTADIAHELKTPIAELRNLSEVGGRWPEDSKMAEKFFEDTHGIGLQMERIVGHLLALARFDEGRATAQSEQLSLARMLDDAWRPLVQQAEERNLEFRNHVPGDAVLETDPEKFRMVVSNLLSNAVTHARSGTLITCSVSQSSGRWALTVSNQTEDLETGDLSHMFDRFWRKDKARTGGRNAGLGLSLVQAFAEVLEFRIETELTAEKVLRITLSRSQGSGA